MHKKYVFFILMALAGLTVTGQSIQMRLDAYFQALAANQQFSGNVLVIEKNQVVYERSFGYADFTTKVPNTKNIGFPVASISKLFTATAILQLYEKGKLRVTDPVTRYLPEFPYPEITIRQLMSHTSGLPPYNSYFDEERKLHPEKVFTNKDFLPGLQANRKALIYTPGEKGNYDNINYIVLALLIEKLSGSSYEDYIKEKILIPAGMRSTYYFPLPDQFNRAEIGNFSFPHINPYLYDTIPVKSASIPYVRDYWHAYGFAGFGDYVSTTHDLWKFEQALFRKHVLKAKTLKEAFTPVKLNNGKDNPGLFGLGWEVEPDSSIGKLVYHSGAAMGLSSNIMKNVSRDQTVVVFDNLHFNAHEHATNAMLLLNGKKIGQPRKSIARIYGSVLHDQGAVAARELLYRLTADTLNYYLSEDEMNSMGYAFLGNDNPYHLPEQHFFKEAVETLKLNVSLFPGSWNAYDSYAEALLADGQKEEAIQMYRRSLELNPGNENGKKMLEKLMVK